MSNGCAWEEGFNCNIREKQRCSLESPHSPDNNFNPRTFTEMNCTRFSFSGRRVGRTPTCRTARVQHCLTSRLYIVTALVTPVESSSPHVLPERRSKNVTAAPKYRKAATVRCISWRYCDKRCPPPPWQRYDWGYIRRVSFCLGDDRCRIKYIYIYRANLITRYPALINPLEWMYILSFSTSCFLRTCNKIRAI